MTSASTLVNLCDICVALDSFIPDVGGSWAASGGPASECTQHQHTCLESHKFRLLWNSTNAAFRHAAPVLTLAADDNASSSYSMSFTATESETVARLLVFAFLGQHVVPTLAPGASLGTLPVAFTYNIISQTLDTSHPVCEYEKGFYMALLVASVVVIIAALTMRFLESTRIPGPAPADALTHVPPNQPTPNPNNLNHPHSIMKTHFGSAQHVPDLRYRLVPGTEW